MQIYLFFIGIPTLGKNVLVAGRSKNVGMPIAVLLHTDGAHERPGGKGFAPRDESSSPLRETLERLPCGCLEVLTLLNFVFVVILLIGTWGVIFVGEAVLSVT